MASLVRRTSVPLAVCALTTSGYGQYQYNNVPAMPSVPNLPAVPTMPAVPDSGGAPSGNQVLSYDRHHYTPGISGQVDAKHSPNIRDLLTAEYKLEVDQRHSQLITTARNVRRLAVTDSSICNYVQYSPTELAIVGLSLGTTDLMIWFEGEDTPAIYEVTVVRDENMENQQLAEFGRLERRISELFPNSNVYLVPVGAQVLVKGQAYDSEEADQILQIVRSEVIRLFAQFGSNYGQQGGLQNTGNFGLSGLGFGLSQNGAQNFGDIVVNMLQVPGEFNVKLKVVIAEISRTQIRNLGIDIPNIDFNGGRHTVSSALGGSAGATLSGIFENGEINVLVRWLASNGTATLLAEPTVVCMSGHPASLLAGGEFAVPTIIGLGGGQNTSFRGVGTSMIVTPTVIDRDLVRLQIVPEFSAIDGNNAVNGIPGVSVKRVQTTVELREGQTLALGGLISRQTRATVNRIPLLGDIPYIGSRLFHSKDATEDEVELLVLVSPEIVRPMEPDEVPPLPNFYVTHPNDHDLWHLARTEGNPDQTVYQVQPYGTGATHGVPSDYHLESASAVPQYTQGGMNGAPAGGGYPMGGGYPAGNGQQFNATPAPQPETMLPPPGPQGVPGPGYGGQYQSGMYPPPGPAGFQSTTPGGYQGNGYLNNSYPNNSYPNSVPVEQQSFTSRFTSLFKSPQPTGNPQSQQRTVQPVSWQR
ncbi:MAG: pilus assembly protein N-terminal domain-containing protein [Planctomycetaceae bacterium]|nr:pilus assembly protein N-terminal domain-containing protein [Planctomycetaceae bacterium]